MELPNNAEALLKDIWDKEQHRFHAQETYILDYKETIPTKFSDGYGAGIIRLALGYHNSYGGIIIFGVNDKTLKIVGLKDRFDIEAFNRSLTDFADIKIECLSKQYFFELPEERMMINVIVVPKRGLDKPIRLVRQLGTYKPGTLWIRDRHEVLEARAEHVPMLYSTRRTLPEFSEKITSTIHRSFPPSPATMKEFVGREKLVEQLWSWFVFGDEPRLYLHGPGGSGKSTLAFEFAQLLADNGSQIQNSNAEQLDYVVYISGKESELNPFTGTQEDFAYRQFSNSQEQFAQILYHSGQIDIVDLHETDEILKAKLKDLFGNYNGLIVVDDIDALSRRKIPTGEEILFVTALRSNGKTKILYTLRYPPSHALDSAVTVPGLEQDSDFPSFTAACSRQFRVPEPSPELLPRIYNETSGLPLLIETIVGLRKFCGTYQDSLKSFQEKGGEEARNYLYRREYDQLDRKGKSKQVLAVLSLLKEPTSFSTLISLSSFSREQIRDALSECGSIFLSHFENENNETLYQLSPPSIPFIGGVSKSLDNYDSAKRKIEHFQNTEVKSTPEELQIIQQLERLIRQRRFRDVSLIGESITESDPVFSNPRIQSLLGQAYAELGGIFRESARKAFASASSTQYSDISMMRSWYYLEMRSGDGSTLR